MILYLACWNFSGQINRLHQNSLILEQLRQSHLASPVGILAEFLGAEGFGQYSQHSNFPFSDVHYHQVGMFVITKWSLFHTKCISQYHHLCPSISFFYDCISFCELNLNWVLLAANLMIDGAAVKHSVRIWSIRFQKNFLKTF